MTLTLRDASPYDLDGRTITIFGCGTIGSRAARHLAHWGAQHIVLCDDDVVEDKNTMGPSSQIYRSFHVGRPKVEALAEILKEIHPGITVTCEHRRIVSVESLNGVVFAGLDSFDGRVDVRDSCFASPDVSLLSEGRLGDLEGRVFTLDPQNFLHIDRYSDEGNWRKWVEPDPEEVCGGTQTNVMLAELAAMNMVMGLWGWLLKERGSEISVANDTVFWVEPGVGSHRITWSEQEIPEPAARWSIKELWRRITGMRSS